LGAFQGRPVFGKKSKNGTEQAQVKVPPTMVEIVRAHKGGIDRLCTQPGTIEPFESADCYAKVSGYLVDRLEIGTKVKKGDILARISVPEYEKQVKKDEASVVHAQAKQRLMEARLSAVKAEAKAAEQMIVQAKIEWKSKTAYRSYRFTSLERIKNLRKDDAVDAILLDQETDKYEAACEAENAAREGILTAELKTEAAKARIAQAEADIDDAKAEVNVAKAELERSKVLLSYTIIPSDYDGVVTKRNFNRGDFIRSADAGGDRVPIVAVDRIDLMRMVVQVPDRDVPFVDEGDKATIKIDALPGRAWKGVIARSARAEDPQTRTMRTEIDVPNPDGKLSRNMYGRVEILLQPGSPTALRIPSGALVGKVEAGQAKVRVVRDGRAHFQPVTVGTDNGEVVEILRGLKETDDVIARANGPVEEGTEVTTEAPAEPEADDD
jgi:RND family efflux transporter MFP subunit